VGWGGWGRGRGVEGAREAKAFQLLEKKSGVLAINSFCDVINYSM